jgi:hypothetical protein
MSRQTGASDASVTPCARSVQVGEFEVAIHGGIWVAIGAHPQPCTELPRPAAHTANEPAGPPQHRPARA